MNHPIKHVDFVHKYLDGIFAEDVHAKRVMSLANGAVGVMTGASLAVLIIGQSLAQARGLPSKHAIKQVDRPLSNQGIVVWDMFARGWRKLLARAKRLSSPWTGRIPPPWATFQNPAKRDAAQLSRLYERG